MHFYSLFLFGVEINGQKCPEVEDSCKGLDGGDFCKSCGYKSGECGGLFWQFYQCFRNRAEMLFCVF
ncbi:unnamed protein product [Adineta steineri]|uniref:Uncharacterized protein n=1 Tax=Adineta steineri TaxID=433720 RepID=A0A813WGA8_9BILA|nr:unnamed protein product [Adineta steineri]CAF3768317.1 unnamed protein product [Adineta steineri]